MAKRIGSQFRETLEESGYQVVSINSDGEAILRNADGQDEVWGENDDHAGYTIEIDGIGYEFCRDSK